MKGKDEKELIKLRFAVGLEKARGENSLRGLASDSQLESAHVQRIAAGKVDTVLTTLISLAEGLCLTFAELATYYDEVTEKDIQEYLEKKEEERKLRKRGRQNNEKVLGKISAQKEKSKSPPKRNKPISIKKPTKTHKSRK